MSDTRATCVDDDSAVGLTRPFGFTLVEMLVVLAIIGLLMAIMVGVAARVSEVRERTACASNLRNVGVSTWTFAMDHRGALPEHHTEDDATFDTTMMRTEDELYVNLGQVLDYLDQPKMLYCPSHDDESSPSLAYNSKSNKFKKPKKVKDEVKDKGTKDKKDKKDKKFDPPAGVNSSFASRTRLDIGIRQPAWAARNFGNKVIYADFIGVDGWQPKGRWTEVVRAPHRGVGYNRLFGDGAVNWTFADPLNALRPIDEDEPTAEQIHQYYELLDVLP
jgi:prepilin-type N-terminal cleavage/methylation domain-containing protein